MMTHISWVDGAILVILALSMVTGLVRGLIKEAVALCVWILAIWFAVHDFQLVNIWVGRYVVDKTAQIILSVLVIIVGAVVLGGLINGALGFILRRAGLSGTDRLLGMLFGLIRGVFIVSILILVTRSTSLLPASQYNKDSLLYPQFLPIVNWLSGYTPGMIQQVKSVEENEIRRFDALVLPKHA